MEAKKKAERLHKRVNTFILSCVDENGYPLTKAFAKAITKNSKSCVYFYSRLGIWNGCYLKGDMEIVTDMSVKEMFWDKKYKNAYSQKTFTDPAYCLLKFFQKKGASIRGSNSKILKYKP